MLQKQKLLVKKGRQLEIPTGMVLISFSSGFFRQLSVVSFLHFSSPESLLSFLSELLVGEQTCY